MKKMMVRLPVYALLTIVLVVGGTRLCAAATSSDSSVTYNLLPVLHLSGLTINSDTVNKDDKVELTFSLDQTFANPYDPSSISVEVTFNPPTGSSVTVYGFYDVPYTETFLHYSSGNYNYFTNPGTGVWKVRFAPQKVGPYTGTLRVITASYQTITTAIPSFQVNTSTSKGFIGFGNSGKFLTFQNGSFYYPLGQNIAPTYTKGDEPMRAGDSYHYQLTFNGQSIGQEENAYRQLATAGGNTASYLMGSSRNAALRWLNKESLTYSVYPGYSGLSSINQMSAQQMDNLIELSASLGIYNNINIINGAAVNETMTGDNGWDHNPYNAANGGPATDTLAFFTNSEAKRLYKQELRYFVSRWGYSPNISTIEMLSELDGVFESVGNSRGSTYRDQVIAACKSWSAEMAAYIRSLDPNQHLIGTSEWSPQAYITGNSPFNLVANNTFVDGTYNVASQHVYMLPQMTNQVNRNVRGVVGIAETITGRIAMPWVIGEWGLDLTGSGTADKADTSGIGYHNAQWAAMMRGLSIWPYYVLPKYPGNNLPSLAAVQAYVSSENFEIDFGSLTAVQSRANVSTDNGSIYAVGFGSNHKALVWLQNTSSIESSATPSDSTGVNLTVSNLAVGNYKVEFWDTWVGILISSRQVHNSGSLVVTVPSFTRDIAVKVKPDITVTINQAADQVDPTSSSPINFTVIFSEAVSDFAIGDVILTGTAGATTASVTGSGTTYNIAVTGMTGSGTVIAALTAGVATGATGNVNEASTSSDNSVVYSTGAPAPNLTSITISDTVGYTKSPTPTISIVSSGSPSHVAFSCDGGTHWSSWIAYSDSISSFNLTSGATGCAASDGAKTITAKLKNSGSLESGTASDSTFYDTTAPTLSSKTTFSGWYTGNYTSTFTYTDGSGSGISSGTPVTCLINTEGTSQTCIATPNVCDALGNCNTTPVTSNGANVDKTAPAGGSIDCTDGYHTSTTVVLTVGNGTDTISGINTASRTVQRRSATLSTGTCGGYGAWGTIVTNGAYPNLTDVAVIPVASGNCYQYRYLVSDNATNQTIYTSANTAKIDTSIPSTPGTPTPTPAAPTNQLSQTWNFTASTDAVSGLDHYSWRTTGTAMASGTSGTNSVGTTLGEGNYIFYVKAVDTAGNQSSESQSPYTVDTTVPIVALNYNPASPVGAGILTITATYSENVNASDSPTISINQPGSTDISNATMTVGSDRQHWTYGYTVNAANVGTYVDGTATVSLSTVHDAAGNLASVPTNANFIINTSNPIITVTNPNSDPAQSKVVTANTSIGTLTMKVLAHSSDICDGSTGYAAYASTTFTSESDNGKAMCYWAQNGSSSYQKSAAIASIDRTAPTATISSSTLEPAMQVVATLNPSEAIIVTNNSNSSTYTFSTNTSFTFTFQDAAGNTGSAVATVSNIVSEYSYRAFNFVKRMYTRALGREVEAGGLHYWYNRLLSGKSSKLQIIDVFIRTDEYYRHYVSGIYHEFMNRDADTAGLNFWTDEMLHGLSKTDLIAAFAYSPEYLKQEYTQFITALYKNFMNRTAEASGLSYWTTQLSLGYKSKHDMIRDFFYSYEFNAKYVQEQYQQILERSTDSGGEHYFVWQLQQGTDRLQLTAILLDSDEFWNK